LSKVKDVGVTVYCLVYNHEKYIRECLDSLVHQNTGFDYKVIVHDDASTDGSAAIVREFEQNYPDRIVAIYQTENQRKGIVKRYIEPIVHSRYVAICEGDDYWTDPNKLQEQYAAMEAHPECGMCVHRTLEVTEAGEPTGLEHPEQRFETGVITPEQLFQTFGKRIFHTSSFFMREPYWHAYITDPPEFRKVCPVGDMGMLLYFGSRYGVYQIDKLMSCYRRGSAYSWSQGRFQKNGEKLIKYHGGVAETFRKFDQETEGRYHAFCVERASSHFYAKSALEGTLREFLKPANAELLHRLSPAKRASVFVGSLAPFLIRRAYLKHVGRYVEEERSRWK